MLLTEQLPLDPVEEEAQVQVFERGAARCLSPSVPMKDEVEEVVL